ncbi:hypothetical protein ACEWF6_08945 [Bifidobacterium catenulatum subsp. kashiwanohense]
MASGAKAHRPELDRILDLLREGDTVGVEAGPPRTEGRTASEAR